MSSDCDYFRPRLAEALFETDGPESRALRSHLDTCAECREELQATRRAIETLHSCGDEPVPRHFFVYPAPGRWSRLGTGWTLGALAVAASLLLVAGLVFTQLQFRIEPGVVTIGWKQLPDRQPVVTAEQVKAELQDYLEERLQARDADWQVRLRSVAEGVDEKDQDQEQRLRRVIGQLERRQAQQLETRSAALESDYEDNLMRLWHLLQSRHEEDFGLIREQLQLMTVSNEIHDTRNEALAATLLQMADLRLQE